MANTYVLFRSREIDRDSRARDDYGVELTGDVEGTPWAYASISELSNRAREENLKFEEGDKVTTIPALEVKGNVIRRPVSLESILAFRKALMAEE